MFPGVPVQATVTHGNASERDELRKLVQPGGFYVADRGYADYSLFREFDEKGVRFLIRLQENAVFEVLEERPLSAADRAAGVVRDVTLKRLGTQKHNALLKQPLRIVQVQGSQPDHVWVLALSSARPDPCSGSAIRAALEFKEHRVSHGWQSRGTDKRNANQQMTQRGSFFAAVS